MSFYLCLKNSTDWSSLQEKAQIFLGGKKTFGNLEVLVIPCSLNVGVNFKFYTSVICYLFAKAEPGYPQTFSTKICFSFTRGQKRRVESTFSIQHNILPVFGVGYGVYDGVVDG